MSRYIDEHRERFGVEPICRTLDVSASAYYERAKGRRPRRAIEDERLLAKIEQVHADNYEASARGAPGRPCWGPASGSLAARSSG